MGHGAPLHNSLFSSSDRDLKKCGRVCIHYFTNHDSRSQIGRAREGRTEEGGTVEMWIRAIDGIECERAIRPFQSVFKSQQGFSLC